MLEKFERAKIRGDVNGDGRGLLKVSRHLSMSDERHESQPGFSVLRPRMEPGTS
jgi:hypothetical protein